MKRDLTGDFQTQRHAADQMPYPTLTVRRERLARLARMTKHHQLDYPCDSNRFWSAQRRGNTHSRDQRGTRRHSSRKTQSMALDAPLGGQHALAATAGTGSHCASATGRCRRDIALELPMVFVVNAGG